MGADQVAHVNIVANACAIRRRIISAKDCDIIAFPESRLDGDFDKMRGPLALLTTAAVRVRAGDVEVSKGAVVERMSGRRIAQHPLSHQLRGAVRVDRARRVLFSDWNLLRSTVDSGG